MCLRYETRKTLGGLLLRDHAQLFKRLSEADGVAEPAPIQTDFSAAPHTDVRSPVHNAPC